MTWEEEDWVDEEATSHREPDECQKAIENYKNLLDFTERRRSQQ